MKPFFPAPVLGKIDLQRRESGYYCPGYLLFAGSAVDGDKPVFVCVSDADNPAVFEKLIHVMNYIKRGRVVVFLEPPFERDSRRKLVRDRRSGRRVYQTIPGKKNILLRTGLFPLELKYRSATGNWVPVGHAVKKHPIFEGLSVNCLMGQDYQNVCAVRTITNLQGQVIVSSISWEWRGDRSYLGPGDAWWGSDLAIVPHGKGKIILSTLQILENLGKDPVADKIFYNMANFAAESIEPLEPAAEELEHEVKEYMEKFESIKKSQHT